MREILFRGKRKDSNKWVYGDLLQNNDCIKIREILIENIPQSFGVISETVGQYTGLTDKNGKKIFEGDILRYCDIDEVMDGSEATEFFGEVVFENGSFGIGSNSNIPLDFNDWCNNDNYVSFWEIVWNENDEEETLHNIEVVGNIHDNPELLEAEE